LTAGEAKNVDNAVVLARIFNEASGQKAPSKKHGLFISRPLVYEYVAAWITMEVNSALDAVGFTAAFAQALTEHSIGCNVVAAFHHDHLFVGRADGKRAVEILQKLTG
jgi:hypothetical protein